MEREIEDRSRGNSIVPEVTEARCRYAPMITKHLCNLTHCYEEDKDENPQHKDSGIQKYFTDAPCISVMKKRQVKKETQQLHS